MFWVHTLKYLYEWIHGFFSCSVEWGKQNCKTKGLPSSLGVCRYLNEVGTKKKGLSSARRVSWPKRWGLAPWTTWRVTEKGTLNLNVLSFQNKNTKTQCHTLSPINMLFYFNQKNAIQWTFSKAKSQLSQCCINISNNYFPLRLTEVATPGCTLLPKGGKKKNRRRKWSYLTFLTLCQLKNTLQVTSVQC